MSERIDQFCDDLRVKLTSIERDLQSLKENIDAKAKGADHAVRARLSAVKMRIEQDRAKITAAQNDFRRWSEESKAATERQVAEWIAQVDHAKLQSRAKSAQLYADAAGRLASAAVDEAEQAALEAWLARRDAARTERSNAA
jgi:hypothetical protein